MVKIRLRRVGAKKQPSYRVVVADSRSPRDGRFIEVIGFYNPRTEPETVAIKEGRALHWLNVGAQPTDAVTRLLKKKGTLARFERLRQGEALEALVAEAEQAARAEAPVSPKTRLDTVEPAAVEPAAEPKPAGRKSEAPKATEAESKAVEAAAPPPAETAEEAAEEEPAASAEKENGG
jgi:small subunit ribosomal protein S16